MPLTHSSSRPPEPLKDADYDHRIILVDHSQPLSPEESTRSSSAIRQTSLDPIEALSTQRSGVPLHKHGSTLKQDIARRRWAKRRDVAGDESGKHPDQIEAAHGSTQPDTWDEGSSEDEVARGRPKKKSLTAHVQEQAESVIEILYENERGGFLCGIPLFSSRALGNLDPAPWTNAAFKTSATNPTNAQVPDPSWEWAWRDWSVNKTAEVDEAGWEYSFAFSKYFTWHGPNWWNSFVRRRAWLRKRVKKRQSSAARGPTMLSENYFTIPSVHTDDLSRSRTSSVGDVRNRYSLEGMIKRQEADGEIVREDIRDIQSLVNVLRFSRIDREKMEALENFIRHAEDDLHQLAARMPSIMRMFIFQASRRLLLAHLIQMLEEQSDKAQTSSQTDSELLSAQDTTRSLKTAVEAAEKEVRELEFWSDVKGMAEAGETKGAVDRSQGWDESWAGLDASGPKELSPLPGEVDHDKGVESSTVKNSLTKDKGKETA